MKVTWLRLSQQLHSEDYKNSQRCETHFWLASVATLLSSSLDIFSNLENNRIQTIPNGTFSEIGRINELWVSKLLAHSYRLYFQVILHYRILANNPLVCDCQLRWLPGFIDRNSTRSPLITTLGMCSVNFTDVEISSLETEDFECGKHTSTDLPCIPLWICLHILCAQTAVLHVSMEHAIWLLASVNVMMVSLVLLVVQVSTIKEYIIWLHEEDRIRMHYVKIHIIACHRGTFGVGCLQSCTCVVEHESSPCDHVTGECHCLPGYNGSSCEAGINLPMHESYSVAHKYY